MGQYTSYYLYQKYEQRGEQEAIPVYPNVYSIDADGTRERVVKIQDDPQCGYDPPVKPIYKWVNIPITQDYVCDDCPTYQTRWVRTDETICSGTPEPPTPTDKKFVGTYNDGTTKEVECNGDGTLTSGETEQSGYTQITSAIIGQCVTNIGYKAFVNGLLTNITIPNSVTGISDYAFSNCDILQSVNIPSGVTSIDYWAFQGCRSLTSIVIPDSVTSIGEGAFLQCSGLTSCTIGNGVTYISPDAFSSCSSLTSINIPNGVTSIGRAAFYDCSGLTSATIGSGVTSIGNSVFYRCTSLTNITIPDSVTSIGNSAFSGCTSLNSITIKAITPPTLSKFAFDNTNDCPLLVPASSVSAYKSATNWSTYASRIQPIT